MKKYITILLKKNNGSYTKFMDFVKRPSLPHTLLEDVTDKENITSMKLPISSRAFKTAMDMLENKRIPSIPLPYHKELLLLSKYINIPLLYHITQISNACKIEDYILENDLPELLGFLSDFGKNIESLLLTYKYDTPRLFSFLFPNDDSMNKKLDEKSLINILISKEYSFTPNSYIYLAKNNRPLSDFKKIHKYCQEFPPELASKISNKKDIFLWFYEKKSELCYNDSPFVLVNALELLDIEWLKELINMGYTPTNLIGDNLCFMNGQNEHYICRRKRLQIITWCCEKKYISRHSLLTKDEDIQKILKKFVIDEPSLTPIPRRKTYIKNNL